MGEEYYRIPPRFITSLAVNRNLRYSFSYETCEDPTTRNLMRDARLVARSTSRKICSDFPAPSVFQQFSQNIYKMHCKDFDAEWRLIYAVKSSLFKGCLDAFYSELYCNFDTWQMMLVFRGTKNVGNIFTDALNVLMRLNGGELNSAFTFGNVVRKFLLDFRGRMQLLITGHSLGGYLAQMVTYTIKHLSIDGDQRVVECDKPPFSIHPHTEVFDAPACFSRITKVAQEGAVTSKSIWLDITNYVIHQNLVNGFYGLGYHLGDVVSLARIDDLQNDSSTWSLIRNISLHRLKNFENVDDKRCSRVVDFDNLDFETFQENVFSAFAFEEDELQLLRDIRYLRLLDNEKFGVGQLGEFTIQDNKVHLQTGQSIRTFLPKARAIIANNRKLFDNGPQLIQERFNELSANANKICKEDIEGITEKLDENTTRAISEWPSRVILNGVPSENQAILGQLLLNSMPETNFVHKSVFNAMDQEERERFLQSFHGTLVLLLEDEKVFIPENGTFRQIAIASDATPIECPPDVEILHITDLKEINKVITDELHRLWNETAATQCHLLSTLPKPTLANVAQTVRNWSSRVVVQGLKTMEQDIMAELIHKSVPRVKLIRKVEFDNMKFEQKVRFLHRFKGTLVFILEDDKYFEPVEGGEFRQIALALDTEPINQPKVSVLQLADLAELHTKITVERDRIDAGNAGRTLQSSLTALGEASNKLEKEKLEPLIYKLDDDVVKIIKNWPQRVVVNGLQTDQQVILAQLIHNTLPETNFIHKSVFDEMEPEAKEQFLQDYNGTFVFLLEDDKIFVPEKGEFRQVALALKAMPVENENDVLVIQITELGNLDSRILSSRSRQEVKLHQVVVLDELLEVQQIFAKDEIEHINLFDLISGNVNYTKTTQENQREVYIPLFLRDTKIETLYSIKEFYDTLTDSSMNAASIVAESGAGKTTYLKQFEQIMKANLKEHCIVHVDLSKQREAFDRINSGRSGMRETWHLLNFLFSCKTNLSERVFHLYFQNKRIFVLLDGYDNLKYVNRLISNQIIKLILSTGFCFVLATNFDHQKRLAAIFNKITWRVYEIEPLSFNDQIQMIIQSWLYYHGADVDVENVKLEMRANNVLQRYLMDEIRLGAMVQFKFLACATSSNEPSDIQWMKNLYKHLLNKAVISSQQAEKIGNIDPITTIITTGEIERSRVVLYEFAAAEILKEGRIESNTAGIPEDLQVNSKLVSVRKSDCNCEVNFAHKSLAEFIFAEYLVCSFLASNKLPIGCVDLMLVMEDVFLADNFKNVRYFMDKILSSSFRLFGEHNMPLLAQLSEVVHEVFVKLLKENLHDIYKMLKINFQFSLNQPTEGTSGYVKVPLYYALKYCNKSFILELVADGASIKSVDFVTPGRWTLHWALEKGLDKIIIENFGHVSPHLNSRQTPFLYTPLYLAVKNSNSRMVQFFLDKGANPHLADIDDLTPLHVAVKNGDFKVAHLLIRNVENLEINARCRLGRTPLHYAILNADLDMVNLLMAVPSIDLTICTNLGYSNLRLATMVHNAEIVLKLLERNAEYVLMRCEGVTALHVAAMKGHLQVTQTLSRVIELDCLTDKGWTPLHFAAFIGALEVVKYLIGSGANHKLKTRDEMHTPLALAASEGWLEVVQYLVLDVLVDVNAADANNRTAAQLAEEKGHIEIAQFLQHCSQLQ